MLNTLRRRMAKEEEGFTLIELMVVILIIAILMAIAIPTFLGAQERAQDRGAQSNLRNALTAAKTIATDNSGTFTSDGTTAITDVNMETAEPSLTYVDGDPVVVPAVGNVAVAAPAGGANIVFYTQSASNTFFCIGATSAGTVVYGRAAAATGVDTHAECVTLDAAGGW